VFAHAGLERSAWDRPHRRLVGFARVDMAPGATADVEIEVDWSMLDVRVEGEWVTERGGYAIEVGRHAGDREAVVVRVQR
jgi:beta-glucosidase